MKASLFSRCAALLGTAVLVAALFVSAARAEHPTTNLELTQEEHDYLNDHPVVRVHNETDWPPFNFFMEGKPEGFSIDYMNLVAERLGLKVEYVTGPTWNDFLDMMKSGDLDIMLNIVKTPEREKYLLYTKRYALNPNSILSRRELPYDNLEQLFGKTVSLPKGFFYEEILRRDFPQIKLHLVKNVQESMKAVIFGKADAALGELAVFNYLMDREMMTGLTLSGEVNMGGKHYSELNIATRKDLPLLASALNKAVNSIDPREVRFLRNKWFGENQDNSKPQPLINLSDAEKDWLAKHKNIRLGIDSGYPPFEFIDKNGAYSGMSSDYVKLLEKRLGLNVERVKGLAWSKVLEGIQNKTLDLLPAAIPSPERKDFVNFTNPYLEFPTVIMTRNDYPFVAGFDDLTGKTLAQTRDYAVTHHIESNYPDIKLHKVIDPLSALRAVSVGEAEAASMNLAVATYLIKKHSLDNLKVAAPADVNLPGLSFAVRKDWPQLVGILEKAIASISQEEKSAIRDRWVSLRFDVAPDTQALVVVGMQVGGAALFIGLIILGFIIVRGRRIEQEMREREEAALAKSDFIAVVSHEVRTPMNGVLGMARLLREMHLDEEQRNCVNTIVDSGEALITIINDLLDLSKLDADRLEIERLPFAVNDVVTQAMELMKSRADENGLTFTSTVADSIPAIVIGDPHRLRQILLNLLSNSIKFTSTGSVKLAAKLEHRDGDVATLTFSVTDTGRGIETGALDKLFSAYTQGSAEVARKYGGTGLGLAICRRLANLMDGEITVDSTFGEGSTFQLTVPYAIGQTEDAELLHEAAARTELVQSAGQSPRPLNVLQVEDNKINRAVVERILSRVGHMVTTVGDGEKAVAQVLTGRYDVVLMDRHMPVMDGIEATRQIRAMDGALSSIPIIGITAGASSDEIAACFEAGMNECLIKPIDPGQLRTLLDGLDVGEGSRGSTHVLVVDDVKINRTVAAAQLKNLGRSFTLASSGEEALEHAKATAYGLILLDITMPGIDGIEFTKLFRQWEGERGRHTPIVAVTGNVSPDAHKIYFAMGMDDVLVKPLAAEELIEVLQKWSPAAVSPQKEVAATQKKADDAPPINLAGLSRIIGEDDEDTLFSILDIFNSEFPQLLKSLEAAVKDHDVKATHTCAHTAKGAAANAAATHLQDDLLEIQKTAHLENWDEIESHTIAVAAEYAKVVQFCNDRRGGG